MLQDQVIPISLDGGTDTKTNPKTVVPGKFLFVENGVFTNPGEVEKRNGYSAITTAIAGGGNLVSPQMSKVFNGELLTADQGKLLGYSPSQSLWVKKGDYTSVDITRLSIDQAHSSSGYVDCAVSGNYTVYAWSTVVGGNPNEGGPYYPSVYGSIVDNQTGATVLGPVLLSDSTISVSNPVRCVLLSGSIVAVVYNRRDGSKLVLRIVDLLSGFLSFQTEQILSTTGYLGTSQCSFDVCGTSTGGVIAYPTSTGLTVGILTIAGAISTTATLTQGGAIVSLNVEPTTGTIWVYTVNQTLSSGGRTPVYTAGSLIYATFNSSLSPLQGQTTLLALSSPYIVSNLVAMSTGVGTQSVYYGILSSNGSNNYVDATYQVNLTSGQSSLTPWLFGNGITPYSKIFSSQTPSTTHSYAIFAYRGMSVYNSASQAQIQPTYFVIDLSASSAASSAPAIPVVVGRFAAGLANNQAVLGSVSGGGLIAYTPNVQMVSASLAVFSCGVETQEFNSDTYETQSLAPGGLNGSFAYSLNFKSARAYKGTNGGSALILNGGLPQIYDGQSCTEWGFHLLPEITQVASSAASGSMTGGAKYSYIAIFQWTDCQGNLHQSEPSLAASLTLGAGNTSATVTVSTPFLSSKQNVSVAIYRTQNLSGTPGTVYYLVSDPVFLVQASALNATTVTFTDTVGDTNLTGNPQAYNYPGSAAIQNTVVAPTMIMATRNNRVWYVDAENPNTVGYTKSFSTGTGFSPSGLLTMEIDPKHGNIAGLSELDSNMVVFKDQGTFLFAGDGADDTGANSTLSTPQVIPTDQGCNSLKSILLTPSGVFFKGPKGIYLLDRALQSHYVGAEVEKWNAQSITAATLVTDKSQIRFLTDSGVTLVYDYLLGKWAYFTNHQGYAADNYQGLYTYVRTDGNIYQENGTSFLDNATAFRLRARLGWLALAGVQGFQRVRRLGLLGDYSNGSSSGHGVQISAAYDFVETFLAAVSYLFGGASSNGTFQYRERLLQQKCDSLSLLIEEVTTGASGESVALTNLSLEAGVKRGIRKAPASQTVG